MEPTRRDALKWIAAGSLAACSGPPADRERGAAILGVHALDGMQWPTPDPFLFCVHHDDAYPLGNERFGPAASLEGRELGRDFAGKDGWRMYHGGEVPGFPRHPHRGFETITIVRRGLLDHSDSMGAAARYGRGDVQWLTAGRGIQHSEMFPLLSREAANPVELFQIWLNLPRADKLVAPHFAMLWDRTIPRLSAAGVDVTVIAGALGELRPPAPPPKSWAARADSDVAIWTVRLQPGATWQLPAARAGSNRWLYVFTGSIGIDGREIPNAHVASLRADHAAAITSPVAAELLLLQGRPIGEPVVQRGPFVMTTRAEIDQTIAEFQRTGFGDWRWPTDEPVHGADATRFARHPDGRTETA